MSKVNLEIGKVDISDIYISITRSNGNVVDLDKSNLLETEKDEIQKCENKEIEKNGISS